MNFIKIIVLIGLIKISIISKAQTVYFQKAFGDTLTQSIGKSVLQLADGSIYFTGNYNKYVAGTQGIELIKMDSLGNLLWKKNLITGYAYANRSIFTTNNTILINGQFTDSTGNTNALVINTDTAGNIIYLKTYGNLLTTESLQSLLQASDGGYIFSGFSTNPAGPGNAFWVIKTDSVGIEQWQQTFAYNVNSTSDDIVQTADGGFIVTGDKKTSGANYNAHVIKMDSLGGLMWETDLTFPYNSGCKNMIINAQGYYIIIGEAATASSAYFDPFVTKIDTAGNIIWSHTIPCSNNGDAGYDIIEPTPGNYLITGFGYDVATATTDLMVMRLDSLGDEVSRRYYGSSGYDQGFSIVQNYDKSGFLAAGFTNSGADNNYFLVHDDLLGITSNVNEINSHNKLIIFPVPADNLLYFKAGGTAQNIDIILSDIYGNILLKEKRNQTDNKIITSDLAAGVYFLQVFSETKMERAKLMIVH